MTRIEHAVLVAPEGLVLFPGVAASFEIHGEAGTLLVADAQKRRPPRLVVAARRPGEGGATAIEQSLAPIATLAEIVRVMRRADKSQVVLLRGLARVELGAVVRRAPYLIMEANEAAEVTVPGVELDALEAAVRDLSKQLIALSPEIPDQAQKAVDLIEGPGALADAAAAHVDMGLEDRLRLLELVDVGERLRALIPLLGRQVEVHRVKADIESQVQKDIGRNQREYVLRQKLKAIREELGEGEGEESDTADLEKRLASAGLTDEAQKAADQQLRRLKGMQSASPEYQVARTYLEWLADLPWQKRSEDHVDLAQARAILDEDHQGLDRVKRRIVEYLAVRKLAPSKKGPILLFVGPPGVGKTSLGRSIARTLGRQYVRISLGGVRDEAEIRGHRRTYVGALPGRIVQGMKRAGTKNPVFVLDEIDKLASDFRGDPAAALLEVLDPEQNNSFSDHYLEIPIDLSQVMFIATANQLDTIPAPLRDRMEIIELPGYTQKEKVAIARDHLVPRQLAEHGLAGRGTLFDDATLLTIVEGYTREAGVRELERQIGSVCRSLAVDLAAGDAPVELDARRVATILGPPRFLPVMSERNDVPGVTTGLAWTPTGGEVLFVEATQMPGHGKLVLTGQLGDVMKESAQAAVSWTRSHTRELGLDPSFFDRADVHIHVPAGAVPKDGPSAGVALATTVVSLLTGRKVRADVAMTGELTLRGRVLPVGGIKEKVLAAHRAGVHTVFLPERNRKDTADIPADVRDDLDLRFVGTVEEVLSGALEPAAAPTLVPVPTPDPRLATGAGPAAA
jgi:ATP-dependent Lon protease